MSNKVKQLIVQASDTDGICASQTIALGSLLINGALASGMTAANILTLTMAADQTSATFLVTGLNANGVSQSETVTGVNATTANTTKCYKQVTSIVVGGTIAGGTNAITVGHTTTNGFVSESIAVNGKNQPNFKAAIAVVIGTSATYTVQYTLDEPQVLTTANTQLAPTMTWFNHDTMVGLTSSSTGNIFFQVAAIRLRATAASGTLTMTVKE